LTHIQITRKYLVHCQGPSLGTGSRNSRWCRSWCGRFADIPQAAELPGDEPVHVNDLFEVEIKNAIVNKPAKLPV
jgi:hypothetical protein